MFYIAIRRFLELLIPEVLLSMIFSALFFNGIFPSYQWLVMLVCGVMLVAYIIFCIFMLRVAYMGIDDIPVYVGMNLVANVCFIVVNLLLYTVLDNVTYTWLFAVFKVAHYMSAGIGIGTSMILIQLILLLMIFVAPFGLILPSYQLEEELPEQEDDGLAELLQAIDKE